MSPPVPTEEERAEIRTKLDALYAKLGHHMDPTRARDDDGVRKDSKTGLPPIDPAVRAHLDQAARARIAMLGYVPCDAHSRCNGGPCKVFRA